MTTRKCLATIRYDSDACVCCDSEALPYVATGRLAKPILPLASLACSQALQEETEGKFRYHFGKLEMVDYDRSVMPPTRELLDFGPPRKWEDGKAPERCAFGTRPMPASRLRAVDDRADPLNPPTPTLDILPVSVIGPIDCTFGLRFVMSWIYRVRLRVFADWTRDSRLPVDVSGRYVCNVPPIHPASSSLACAPGHSTTAGPSSTFWCRQSLHSRSWRLRHRRSTTGSPSCRMCLLTSPRRYGCRCPPFPC